jgi:hypothetical protein
MTSSLRQRAAAAAAEPATTDAWPAIPTNPTTPAPAGNVDQLEPVDAPEETTTDPDQVPVQVAVARLMRDLGVIAKRDRFDGGNAGRYDFRGVDRVVNAVAPLLRKHGVIVIPDLASIEYRDVVRTGGGRSHECVVQMRYHWVGPKGDELVACAAGESLDTSDKGTAKAQAVAWRVCLIQMLAIPTGDPDPDSINIERGEQPVPSAAAYRDEIVHPATSLGRLKQIRAEIGQHRIAGVSVVNENGDDEALGMLLQRVGKERQGTP